MKSVALALSILLVLGAPAVQRGLAQQPDCASTATQPGRAEAIGALRMVNTVQNHTWATSKKYLGAAELQAQMTHAQVVLPAGGVLDTAAEGASYLAAVTVSGNCPIAFFTTQTGLIFAGAPIR